MQDVSALGNRLASHHIHTEADIDIMDMTIFDFIVSITYLDITLMDGVTAKSCDRTRCHRKEGCTVCRQVHSMMEELLLCLWMYLFAIAQGGYWLTLICRVWHAVACG